MNLAPGTPGSGDAKSRSKAAARESVAADGPRCPRTGHRGWPNGIGLDRFTDGSGWECPGILADGSACEYRLGPALEPLAKRTVLWADPDITCQWDVPDHDSDEDEARPCGLMSRFVVSRSDGDRSFDWDGEHEACLDHLGDVVVSMVDGDESIQPVVAIRWDAAGSAARENAR